MNTQNGTKLKGRSGFTMIELAAAIAAVGLLMAILMPVLGKARRQADSVLCRANLMQVGTLINLYASDNNGSMVSDSRYQYRWYHNLWAYPVVTKYTYTSEYTVPSFYCPIELRKYKAGLTASMYGYNSFFGCYTDTSGIPQSSNKYLWFSNIRKVTQPSTLPIFWDSSSDYSYNSGFNGYPHPSMYKFGWEGLSAPPRGGGRTGGGGPATNHGPNINYLFIDGHAGGLGLWPYNETVSPLNGSAMSFTSPGVADSYLTFFHPLRKLYVTGTSGTRTTGDGFPGNI